MNEIPTVHHNEGEAQNTYEPRTLDESIPLTYDNIPKSTKFGQYFLSIIIVVYLVVNGFLHYDINRQIEELNASVSIIGNEQIARSDKVYLKTKDRIYRQEFQDWLVMFEQMNPTLDVPKMPKHSIYE